MKRSLAVLMAVMVAIVSSVATFFIATAVFNTRLAGDEDSLSLSEFSNVEQIIGAYYLRDYDIEDVQYAGLKAMVAALDDPYSVYYTPEEYAAFNQEAAGEYYGVGMVISTDEVTGLAVVDYFFDESAAKDAGIEVGDMIVSIDGVDVTDKSLQEISVLCIGGDGEAITIGVKRGDEVIEYDMVRRAVTMDMLSYQMLDDTIGYMAVAQFGGNCEALFIEAMTFFERKMQQAS